ncbi:MAG: C_GCAxxG_C_C family protein [Lachnospiraceae bacterium]|nr:C_GCAxxG_C_C family protein [Lachnospiraceae bacterium]
MSKEERIKRAGELFSSGYNCCQSVFAAFADKYGIDEQTALKLSCSFGGGMGRMREVCGAVSGMALVCGMETGNTDGANQTQKKENYEKMRELADRFKEENGSIICRQLLGLEKMEESAEPLLRTAEYYKKRPCKELVMCAAQILAEEFEEE